MISFIQDMLLLHSSSTPRKRKRSTTVDPEGQANNEVPTNMQDSGHQNSAMAVFQTSSASNTEIEQLGNATSGSESSFDQPQDSDEREGFANKRVKVRKEEDQKIWWLAAIPEKDEGEEMRFEGIQSIDHGGMITRGCDKDVEIGGDSDVEQRIWTHRGTNCLQR